MKLNKLIVLLIALTMFAVSPLFSESGFIDQQTQDDVVKGLLKRHGQDHEFRIRQGVKQAARFWMETDGSKDVFAGLCNQFFIPSPEALEATHKKLETHAEVLGGYFTEMVVDLRRPLQLDWGPISPIDMAFGRFNPAAHLTEDFFQSKIAFAILLNFPNYTLAEKTKLGEKWSRKEWAYARTGQQFTSRVPAEINQERTAVMTEAGRYVAEYNIFVGNLIDKKNNTYFPKDKKLITHWGLRDEIKARYSDANGLVKQKMIYEVMKRIIHQEVPKKVINNDAYQWNPYTNNVYEKGKEIEAPLEQNDRYQHMLNTFNVIKKSDPYNPFLNTHVLRRFEANREIPEATVEALFRELLGSPQAKKVAKLMRKRLKRKLMPFDIWYTGFKGNIDLEEEKLDKMVSEKYPNLEAFQKGIKDILVNLGFKPEKAAFIGSKIRVDPARGAGHCVGASMKAASSRLRTRVPKGGMDYKGFNTAMHELGHAVEQTLTLQDIDYYSLSGVPNTAFTEAFAFVFQDRDLEVLGIKMDKEQEKHLKALDIFWNAYEIMGVSLVDMKAWNWLYAHPDATAAELKEAILSFAKEIWNEYYAPIFKVKDVTILAVYSHMINSALYLPDYPLGHVIQFQVETYLEGKNLADEMQRMCVAGNIIPQLWMKNAVGSEISVKPLLKAVDESLKHIKK